LSPSGKNMSPKTRCSQMWQLTNSGYRVVLCIVVMQLHYVIG
jgi:hypothetical protein